MSDKIIYLHPPTDKKSAPDHGKKPTVDEGKKFASDKCSRTRELSPEFSWRKHGHLKLNSSKGHTTSHYYEKIRRVFYRHGLWHQIVIDETDNILAGIKLFKALARESHVVPVFMISGLSPAEKHACHLVARDWERQLGYAKVRAEEQSHD